MQALARRIYERTAPGRHRAYLLWVKEGVCSRNSSLQISEGTYPRIAFLLVSQTVLALRGSNGIGKGALKHVRALVVHFDQEKPVLGDTCSRLA